MHKARMLTGSVLVAAATILIFYDIYAVLTGGVEATISRVILETSATHPIIAFAAGVLCGHLFWPQDKRALDRKEPFSLRFPLRPPAPQVIHVRDQHNRFVGMPRLSNSLNRSLSLLRSSVRVKVIGRGILELSVEEDDG